MNPVANRLLGGDGLRRRLGKFSMQGHTLDSRVSRLIVFGVGNVGTKEEMGRRKWGLTSIWRQIVIE